MKTFKAARWALFPAAAVGLALYSLWVIYPIIASAVTSLTNASPLKTSTDFVGLANYAQMQTDARLHRSFTFTLIVVIVSTIGSNVIGLAFALLLNGPGRSYKVMRMLAFIPQVLSGVVVAFIWRSILNQGGLLNTWLINLGVMDQAIPWIGTPNLATFSVCVVVTWVNTAFATVVYTASLQSVPEELVDAAIVDGAGWLSRFWNVTWPLIAPGTTISITLSLITSLKLYDVLAVLTGGGPANQTNSVAYYLIQVAFTGNRFGYGSAIGILLLAITAVTSFVSTGLLRRREAKL
ncbi:MAG: sugar ABC transporter permease [Propionibacteriaceae bacterium]|jgi:ABC-type sugar transport system permease subunit|nr:sugar ABC transporter permease [Propionibacteriaceae bacterium]